LGDTAAGLVQENYSWRNATSGLDDLYAHLIWKRERSRGQYVCTRQSSASATTD
jgi:hypothetical protein